VINPGSLAKFAAMRRALSGPLQAKALTHTDEADDHSSDSGEEGLPDIVVGLLLPEPPRLSFITQPTKRCLSFRFIGEATAAIERVAELCLADAFELGAPCRFHFGLGHPDALSMPYEARKRASVCNHSPIMRARCSRSFGQVCGKQ